MEGVLVALEVEHRRGTLEQGVKPQNAMSW